MTPLAYGIAPHSRAAVAVAVKVSWKPSCNEMPYPGITPYRPCHVSSRLIIERTMAKRACHVAIVQSGEEGTQMRRACHVAKARMERTMTRRTCCTSQLPLVVGPMGRRSSIMPSAASSADQ